MSPIFKNIVIDRSKKDIIGDHLFNYCQNNNIPLHKVKNILVLCLEKDFNIYTPSKMVS